MGSTSVKITTDGNISSLTHKLYYSVGSSGLVYITTIGDSSYTWTPALEIAKYITTSTSATATITCKTYSGSTWIGTKTKTLTLNVPSTVVPKLTATVTDSNGYRTNYGSYIVGKSRYKVSMTETTAYGSAISSRSIKMNGETFTSKDPTSSLLKGTSYNSIAITITDKRGRQATYSISDLPTRTYAAPKITSFTTPVRCTQAGVIDENGDYIKTTLNFTYDAFSTNAVTAKVRIIKDIDNTEISSQDVSSGVECILPATHGYTYVIRYEIYDTVSGSSSPATASYTLLSGKAVFSAKKGYQVAVGKSAEQGTAENPIFESAWHTILPSLDVGDVHLIFSESGNRWGVIPRISDGGSMEVGKYIEFHNSDADTSDYTVLLYSDSNDRLHSTSGMELDKGIIIPVSSNFASRKSDGTTCNVIYLTSSENILIGSESGTVNGCYIGIGNQKQFRVRVEDSTTVFNSWYDATDGRYTAIPAAYAQTTSGGSTVRVGSTGILYRYVSSSRRYKEAITTQLNDELNPEKLYELLVVQYKYREGHLSKTDQRYGKEFIGLLAEDIHMKYPIAANMGEDGFVENYNVDILVPAMLKLIQNQKKQLDEQELRIKTLEERLKKIEDLLNSKQ